MDSSGLGVSRIGDDVAVGVDVEWVRECVVEFKRAFHLRTREKRL